MSTPLATVGILSIGSMGIGIAKLLVANNYRVLTNASGRSSATENRAKEARVELVGTDSELVAQSDYILSIVPPRDAVATAARIQDVWKEQKRLSKSPLYYLDLNAISPTTATQIAESFKEKAPEIRLVDGGIIGGPPAPTSGGSWKRPGIPLSGPFPLHEAPVSGEHFASTLYSRYLGPRIGSASGLKCCFASLAKGLTALGIQAYSTAASLDVLPALQDYLDEYNPQARSKIEGGITSCPVKAYRWVEEMNQIGDCFADDGGWNEQARIFRQISGLYAELAKVVEERGGTDGMEKVDGAIGALQEVEELEQDDR
ncbi:6-phosphogluconate dehydrogenase C-terminal domain-like protein [Amniculicola lignicola CBS 123094]|uniref:6-phosphogluconate dehydrogenase C-terminal domain-like protein n=1 Tax=Amniculicola lignicola CBS 123094 TaxID=1392246 RepID=A0A6A5X2H9_9PLEO|nr:6-phosphogluconate dehydrogenase C-terminal domain-like protein [Amniculicola lignicola CBS 123094]